MKYYVGLDVSLKSIFLCVVDETGNIMKQAELPCDPESVGYFLKGMELEIEKIGLESGSLTHWLTSGLRSMGFQVVPMESRKMAAILATVINKTDENDARGITEALRCGHYQECVHRGEESLKVRTVLHSRQTLIHQRTHLTNSIKGHLKVYGIKLGKGVKKDFRTNVENALKSSSSEVQESIKSLLIVLEMLNQQINQLDLQIKEIVKEDEDIQLLKTIDGVGDITALAFKAEIEDPKRFKNSRDVGAYIGLTPRQYSSGEICRQGRISKQGPKQLRYLLVEAATVLLTRSKRWSPLKAWGMKIQRKSGFKKASVAVARKLAVMMHSMLLSREEFDRKSKKANSSKSEKTA